MCESPDQLGGAMSPSISLGNCIVAPEIWKSGHLKSENVPVQMGGGS